MKTDRVKRYSQYFFLVLVVHVLIISVVDIFDVCFGIKIQYPTISNLFIWAVFTLPVVGVLMFFLSKRKYLKILGVIVFFVSVVDIFLFLKQTSGAL